MLINAFYNKRHKSQCIVSCYFHLLRYYVPKIVTLIIYGILPKKELLS